MRKNTRLVKAFSVLTALMIVTSMLLSLVFISPSFAHTAEEDVAIETAAASAPDDAEPLDLEPTQAVLAEVSAAPVVQPKGANGVANYIIQLEDAPAASYRGGVEGLSATNPSVRGESDLRASQATVAYVSYLEGVQAEFIEAASAKLEREVGFTQTFQYAFNGGVVRMSPEEAEAVASLSGVKKIFRETIEDVLTDVGPAWIGADGIWDGSSVPDSTSTLGEGTVVAILDTGINSDHPSFADIGGDGYDHTNPLGSGTYFGVCDSSNPDYQPGFSCNDKLIGVHDFIDGDGNDPDSPEDGDGHGSHTGSTVAGNVVSSTLYAPTTALTKTISGVAPHANIIAYDVCLNGPAAEGGGCPGTALLAAAEQVVIDHTELLNAGHPTGIATINYSISGGGDPYNDAVELAFLAATDAGVFVSASAGNEGPGAGTVAHVSPWVGTIAASTHDRKIVNSLVNITSDDDSLSDIVGAGFTSGYGPAPIVYAGDYPNSNDPDGDPAQCLEPYPAGTFSGEIVVCDRGEIARVAKGQNVLAGGAGGFVLANVDAQGESISGDAHFLPGLHIGDSDGDALRAWIADNLDDNPVATITGYVYDVDPANGDIMAGFSSRGPAGVLDVLKPDVTAPGVSIWAAIHNDDPGTPAGFAEYGFISGTSMSSPHNAGAVALMTALYPDWSPHQIKSAMMTTADNVDNYKEDGVTSTDPFDLGSGRVDLSVAAAAGLVLDETTLNFENADPSIGGDPRTLNLPNFNNRECVLSCTWVRTVESTLSFTSTWTTSVSAPMSSTLLVTPTTFTVPPFGSQTVTVTLDSDGAPVDTWLFGSVMLNNDDSAGVPTANFPVVTQFTTGDLPDAVEIQTRRNAGSWLVEDLQALEITDLTVDTLGLTQADITEFQLSQDPTNGIPEGFFDDLDQVFWMTMTVPANSYSLIAEIVDTTSPDLDMAVGLDTGDGLPEESEIVCQSATGGSAEGCEVMSPTAGTWWVVVLNWEESANAPDDVSLATAVVPNSDNGNMTVEGPPSVPALEPFDIRVFWDTPTMMVGDRWYGAINIGTDPGNPGNIGTIPVYINRLEDDVVKTADPMIAAEGMTVTYQITIRTNVTPEDLTYYLTDTIPAGLTYVPGSATASVGTVGVISDVLTYTGVQPVPAPKYVYTDNTTDPTCAPPIGSTGNYVDVESEYGYSTLGSISGDSISWEFTSLGTGTEFYGEAIDGQPRFTDDGFVLFPSDDVGGAPWVNQNLPDVTLPNGLAAPYWRDMEIVYDETANKGITGVSFSGGVFWLVEFDDIEPWPAGAGNGSLDFEIMAWQLADPSLGTHDLFFAFDNVTITDTVGTVGMENADGTAGSMYAYDDFTPTDGLVVCADYVLEGDIVITYQATVDAGTEGDTLTNEVEHDTDNPGSEEATTSYDLLIDNEAYLQVAHLAPFAMDPGTSVTVTLDGTPVLTDFVYGESTEYLPVMADEYFVEIFPAGSATAAISGTVDLMPGMSYSAIATGDGANQDLGLMALANDTPDPMAGFGKIRLGHIAPFSDTITGTLADVRLQDGTPIATDVAYADVTGFLELPAGEYDLKVTTPGGAVTLIDPIPVTLNDGDVVSAFATGDGSNQGLAVFVWPDGEEGFFLPATKIFLPLIFSN